MDLRAVVVDDEDLAREELCFLLEGQEGVDVVGQATNGIEAVGLLEDVNPDLVFLDIQMPGLSGFEVARQAINRHLASQIVFVTAYDKHAIEAFELNAVDYLLKPVDAGRLVQALERTRRRVDRERQQAPLASQDLERIVQLVTERHNRRSQVAVKVGERFQVVQAEALIFATLSDDVITVVTDQLAGSSSCRTLDELQEQLDPATFWRVHRSYLVNINKVKEIVPWFSRNYILRMKDAKATEIPVSRAQTKRLREHLKL